MKVKWQNGFPIPKRWYTGSQFVNGTPHYSSRVAAEHRAILDDCKMSTSEYGEKLSEWLLRNITDPKLVEQIDLCLGLLKEGNLGLLFDYATNPMRYIPNFQGGSSEFLVRKLLEEETQSTRESMLEPYYKGNVRSMAKWLAGETAQGYTPLLKYEQKSFLKGLSDATRRTGDEYLRSVEENYLPDREAFSEMKTPDRRSYDIALDLLYMGEKGGMLQLPLPSDDGTPEFNAVGDFISSARRTTYGGAPFFKNMGEFVTEDLDDPTTYVDYYNKCAIAYLFLPPSMKEKVLLDFVALERIQQGGVEDEFSADIDADNVKMKKNKQRVVQAMSAVLSHANKFLVDISTRWNRTRIPDVAADKISEADVTRVMKRAVLKAVGSSSLDDSTISPRLSLIGADYSNFDASQNVVIMNDAHYQIWRRYCPKWATPWIIDPYIKLVYARLSITFPIIGTVVTTGVKSGQVDTNDCDTHLAIFSDLYERSAYETKVTGRDPFGAESQDDFSILMANGDDRFKTSLLTAAQVEEFDSQLGFIANAQKQEIWKVGTPLSNLGVTYLKTILCYQDGRLIRTDSILKVILSRFNKERPSNVDRPYSLVLETIMSAMRAYESPYLYVLVDWLAQFELGRAWLLGDLPSSKLIAGASLEGYQDLKVTKGKLWIAKMKHLFNMDIDYIVQQIASKFGLTPDGHRASEVYFSQNKILLDNMEIVSSLRRSALVRNRANILGRTFNDLKSE